MGKSKGKSKGKQRTPLPDMPASCAENGRAWLKYQPEGSRAIRMRGWDAVQVRPTGSV